MGRKPKFDYTSEEFLSKVEAYARNGYTDGEIALLLGLAPQYFSEKKSAISEISETLSRARAQVNSLVRTAFLKTAIGGRTVRQVRYIEKLCECKGKNKDCPVCKGKGWYTSDTERQVVETELAPNLMAQQRWLMNYDPDWKNRVNGIDEDSESSTVEGYDIEVTFNKKEDLELQERVKKKEE